MELGVGMNTPVIIKYPFWKWTLDNSDAKLVTIDANQIMYRDQIKTRTLAIKGDIDLVLGNLQKLDC